MPGRDAIRIGLGGSVEGLMLRSSPGKAGVRFFWLEVGKKGTSAPEDEAAEKLLEMPEGGIALASSSGARWWRVCARRTR